MAVTNNYSTIVFGAGSDAVTGRKLVKYFRWEGMSTAGHDLMIDDANGQNYVTVQCETAELPVEIPIDWMMDGITVSTLDSGRVVAFIG